MPRFLLPPVVWLGLVCSGPAAVAAAEPATKAPPPIGQLEFAGRSWPTWARMLQKDPQADNAAALRVIGTMARWVNDTGEHSMRQAIDWPTDAEIDALLLPLLNHDEARIRALATAALGYRRDDPGQTKRVLPHLLAGLTDGDPGVRANALDSLAWNYRHLDGPQREGLPALLLALSRDPDPAPRRRLAARLQWHLRDWTATDAQPVVNRLLDDDDATVVERTMRHLTAISLDREACKSRLLQALLQADCSDPRSIYDSLDRLGLGSADFPHIERVIRLHGRTLGDRPLSLLCDNCADGMKHYAALLRDVDAIELSPASLLGPLSRTGLAAADLATPALMTLAGREIGGGQTFQECLANICDDPALIADQLLENSDDGQAAAFAYRLGQRQRPLPPGLLPHLQAAWQTRRQTHQYWRDRGGWRRLILIVAARCPEPAAKNWAAAQIHSLTDFPDQLPPILEDCGMAAATWRPWVMERLPTMTRRQREELYATATLLSTPAEFQELLQIEADEAQRGLSTAVASSAWLMHPAWIAHLDQREQAWYWDRNSARRLPLDLAIQACAHDHETIRRVGWARIEASSNRHPGNLAEHQQTVFTAAASAHERGIASTLRKRLQRFGCLTEETP